jgi:hypothetical protein
VPLGRRVVAAIAILFLARPRGAPGDGSGVSVGQGASVQTESGLPPRSDRTRNAVDSPTSLTVAQIEELAEKMAERREKLDYFYITAFTAVLVFTFNNFNSTSGVLVKAPVWLVEVGWASLITAALCPLYVISARLSRYAMNMDWQVGKPFDQKRFKRLRRRSEFVHRAMTVCFAIGVGLLCAAYALGLNHIKH